MTDRISIIIDNYQRISPLDSSEIELIAQGETATEKITLNKTWARFSRGPTHIKGRISCKRYNFRVSLEQLFKHPAFHKSGIYQNKRSYQVVIDKENLTKLKETARYE